MKKDFANDDSCHGFTENKGEFSSGKLAVFRVLTETTVVVPCDPDNLNVDDHATGFYRVFDGMVMPFGDCLETLISTAVGFGIEYDEMTGMQLCVQAGYTESHVVDLQVVEKGDPLVSEVIDNANIKPAPIKYSS